MHQDKKARFIRTLVERGIISPGPGETVIDGMLDDFVYHPDISEPSAPDPTSSTLSAPEQTSDGSSPTLTTEVPDGFLG